MEEVTKHSMHTLVFRSLKRTHDMFISDQAAALPIEDTVSQISRKIKAVAEYGPVLHLAGDKKKKIAQHHIQGTNGNIPHESAPLAIMGSDAGGKGGSKRSESTKMHTSGHTDVKKVHESNKALIAANSRPIVPRKAQIMPKPRWHAPWKLYRVISGHLGWVRCVAFEPGNEWFATGSNDRTIKIWDLANGKLKLSLTGHISSVRGLVVSARNPYLFSCGEDKMVKCWDLEQNKVVRHYHGHLSACHAIDLHPTIDVLVTCGRDSTARVWDMRTKANILTFSGHTNTVADVKCQAAMPEEIDQNKFAEQRKPLYSVLPKSTATRSLQGYVHDHHRNGTIINSASLPAKVVLNYPIEFSIHLTLTRLVMKEILFGGQFKVITASHDCTVRLWDLAAGKTRAVLTNHKKSIRSLALHPTQYTFASGAPDNIKQWKFPDGDFIQNLSGHNAIVNCLALNSDGVLVSGADNGTVHLWDWRTGYNFQRTKAPVQPGSLDSESGVFALAFDRSESRLITCEADKTIKIYKEDDDATEESHPIQWKPEIVRKKRF